MSKILFTILVVCFAQLAYCRVGRQQAQPPATTTPSPWIEALNMLNETAESVHRSFLTIAGVGSDEEFFTKARAQFDTFQNTIKSGADEIIEETKPLQTQTQDLVKAFLAKVDEVAKELKAKNPELFSGDTKKLKEVGERSVNVIIQESKKLQDKLDAERVKITPKLEAALKSVYDSAVKTANDLKVQAESALNSVSKKN